LDNAFGLIETFGARWISREKLYGAQTKGVNRRVIAIKESQTCITGPVDTSFPVFRISRKRAEL
jgi:hypothetical protein